MQDREKDTSTETNGMNQVLEQFTEFIQGLQSLNQRRLDHLPTTRQRLSALVLYDLIFILNHAKK